MPCKGDRKKFLQISANFALRGGVGIRGRKRGKKN